MATHGINESQPLVWIVDSSYTGELHARIGVAERLGFGYELIPLPEDQKQYQRLLEEKYRQSSANLKQPLLVISGTGEDTTAPIADLRQLFNGSLLNVYLASILPDERDPRLAEYDLIASPQLSGENVITLTGVPHPLTQERLDQAKTRHEDFFSGLQKPIIGVLIGGNTRYCQGFDARHAERLANRVSAIARSIDASIVMTNSRRTPESAQNALIAELKDFRFHFFDWQTSESEFYPALLAHADLFIVTGDSLSMCSEAAFTGKPVLVDLCTRATECYHREIVGRLINFGAAKLLAEHYEPWIYTPPDPTEEIVSAIRQRLANM